ncbi:MAG: hypothetical protein LBJ82_05645, partial [Deltaproteobacteria bacterium]|nr:hypothetical protein [Deltaproteobacteria bacterium]
MTTKIKIILGFVAMIAILVFVSIVGYRGMNTVSLLFEEFGQAAALNVASSETVGHINASAYHLEKFMRLSDAKEMEQAIASQEKTLDSVREGLKHITPESRSELELAESHLREYVQALKQMKENLVPWYTDYIQVIGSSFAASEKILGEVGDLALKADNFEAIRRINDVWRMLVSLNTAISAFREQGTPENAARIDNLLEQAQAANDSF